MYAIRSYYVLVAELVREKLFRKLARELPYGLTVEVEAFRRAGRIVHIHSYNFV